MRLAFIGSHQVKAFNAAALRLLEKPEIHVLESSDADPLDVGQLQEFFGTNGHCDYVFVQAGQIKSHLVDSLRAMTNDKPVCITNFRCPWLFPDCCYVDTAAGPIDYPMALNSVAVLDCFLQGRCGRQANNSFSAGNLSRLDLLKSWSDEVEDLRRWEIADQVDIPAAAMVEEACSRYQAFSAPSVPAAALVTDYLASAFRALGVAVRALGESEATDPMSEFEAAPVLDEVAEHYRLPYRTPQLWKPKGIRADKLSREAYLAAFFRTYATPSLGLVRLRSPDRPDEHPGRFEKASQIINRQDRPASTTATEAQRSASDVDHGESHVEDLKAVSHALDQLQGSLMRVRHAQESAEERLGRLNERLSVMQHSRQTSRRPFLALRVRQAFALGVLFMGLGAAVAFEVMRLS